MRRPPYYSRFNDIEIGPDFRRADIQIATPFGCVDIPLDTAKSNFMLDIAGDFLYLDKASSGAITLELNNQQSAPVAPFYADAGFGLKGLFSQLKLSWSAQPGKFVRIMYSTGARVVPTNSISISGTIQNDPPRSSWANNAKTVTTTAAQLVAANAQRKYLLIQNKDSAGNLFIAFNTTATTANGVKIPPGGSYELNCNLPTDYVHAIGDIASNANVVVVEG